MLSLVGPIIDIIKKIIPDKVAQTKATSKIIELQLSGELSKMIAAADVVTAEIKSDSWLTSNWRAMLMCIFGYIIFNNYILVQYASMVGLTIPVLQIPPQMWTLLDIGIGGYIIGRSGEKIVDRWKKK